MRTRIVDGLIAGAAAVALAGCSSSYSTPSTTAASTASTTTSTATSTTTAGPAAHPTGAPSAQDLAAEFVTATSSPAPATFCTTYALPSEVATCTKDFTGFGVTFKQWAVGDVTVQGTQAVITYTGSACSGSQCVSNSDPQGATDPESAAYAGSTFDAAFATANDPNSPNSTPFVAAAVEQDGAWYASGF